MVKRKSTDMYLKLTNDHSTKKEVHKKHFRKKQTIIDKAAAEIEAVLISKYHDVIRPTISNIARRSCMQPLSDQGGKR